MARIYLYNLLQVRRQRLLQVRGVGLPVRRRKRLLQHGRKVPQPRVRMQAPG